MDILELALQAITLATKISASATIEIDINKDEADKLKDLFFVHGYSFTRSVSFVNGLQRITIGPKLPFQPIAPLATFFFSSGKRTF